MITAKDMEVIIDNFKDIKSIEDELKWFKKYCDGELKESCESPWPAFCNNCCEVPKLIAILMNLKKELEK